MREGACAYCPAVLIIDFIVVLVLCVCVFVPSIHHCYLMLSPPVSLYLSSHTHLYTAAGISSLRNRYFVLKNKTQTKRFFLLVD